MSMNQRYTFFCSIFFMKAVLGVMSVLAKPTEQTNQKASAGVVFQGMTEEGIVRNTFLCGKHSVTSAGTSGVTVAAQDCSAHQVLQAIGFDISGGKTVQFFNNFTYWLRQKGQEEQAYQINHPQATQSDIAAHMQSKGWGSMGAYCILISTNEILQNMVAPHKQARAGQIKVIVQLWYNGDNLIQLWSQDVAIMTPGQNFTVVISNAVDSNLITMLQESDHVQGYLKSIGKIMQPNNRNIARYHDAKDSPRMVRIQVS